jgi:uncharacterized repeat protein (TIGR02543 family)
MNQSTKLVLVIGIVLLVWAMAFTVTAGAASEGRAAIVSSPQVFALQPPPTTYTLTVSANPSGGGSATKNPNLPVYISGTIVSLTAAPAVGYKFDNWSGDASGTSTSISVTMTANRSVVANFSPLPTYVLSVNYVGTGTVTKNPDQASYPPGTIVQLTATPGAGWRFGGWSGGGLSGSANPINVLMDSAKTVTATFIRQVSLTVNTAGSGTVSKNPNQTIFDLNIPVQLTANSATGWQFTGWSGALSGTTNPATLVMDGDKTVTANFAAIPTCYTLTTAVSPSGVGVVSINTASNCGGSHKYTSGTTVNLTATANDGSVYIFDRWGGCSTTSGTSCTVAMNTDRAVTAYFVPISQPTSTPTPTLPPTVTPVATITPLSGGVVATVAVAPTPTSALPSTGASPLIWIAAGIVLVLIVIGARYLRQSSV